MFVKSLREQLRAANLGVHRLDNTVAKQCSMIMVTDDRAARRQCTQIGLPTTGTIGILKASVLDGHITISDADSILLRMTAAGFYSPVRTISDIL